MIRCTSNIVCNYMLELTRSVLLLNISLLSIRSQPLPLISLVDRRTCRVGADVASMTQTVRLNSANTLGEVVKHLAIAAVTEDSR